MYSPVLIGLPGVGIAHIGQNLAARLGVELIDGDQKFVEAHGSINLFRNQHGKPAFRNAEADLVARICEAYRNTPVVFVSGDGAVANNDNNAAISRNVQLLLEFGVVFYVLPSPNLGQSAAAISRRLRLEGHVSRFSRWPKLLLGYLEFRHPFYMAAAHEVVYSNGRADANVAAEIRSILETYPLPKAATAQFR